MAFAFTGAEPDPGHVFEPDARGADQKVCNGFGPRQFVVDTDVELKILALESRSI